MKEKVKIIECPRDALQGMNKWVPTADKVSYYQALLKVGFDTLDCVSFVSPKAIPQMSDAAAVVDQLDLSGTKTKLLAIIANSRGAKEASSHEKITYLGYPFSISENFQIRNTNKTIEESVVELQKIIEIADKHDKTIVVYLSMGFGNPYGDPWSIEIMESWVTKMNSFGIKIISLSDTIGMAKLEAIEALFYYLCESYSAIEFGAHFHTTKDSWYEKVNTAFLAGCKRFDGTIKGWGGCPMAMNELVGNMPTERLISYFSAQNCAHDLSTLAFESAYNHSHRIFL